uniref:Uncharacterized protein n=1 Tax=Solanum lycopersicum TaxID=4081 RepID=A0A3Q7GA19_SOLLC
MQTRYIIKLYAELLVVLATVIGRGMFVVLSDSERSKELEKEVEDDYKIGRRVMELKYLCAWGNDAASEVLTEARLLLVENYFQTPSSAWVLPWPSRIFERASLAGRAL